VFTSDDKQPGLSGAFTVRVLGKTVELARAPGVFMPSRNGLFYSRSVRVHPGERVIDIGTGSGVLAIAAAKCGATACATDVDPRAVAAAQRNADLNGVAVEVRAGALFAGFAGPFDVILANLPNEIVPPEYLAGLPPDDPRSFAGGVAGNEHLLALLGTAGPFLAPGGRLYLGVHSLTDYHATLREAIRRFDTRLVDLEPLPVKPFVTANLEFYEALDAAGVIKVFRDDHGRWFSYGYLYELRRPGAQE
jgi:methylase of polypeptide subunit release factors